MTTTQRNTWPIWIKRAKNRTACALVLLLAVSLSGCAAQTQLQPSCELIVPAHLQKLPQPITPSLKDLLLVY